MAGGGNSQLTADEQTLLDDLHHKLGEGAKVIIVIRPPNNPQGPSEVVAVDRASATLLDRLAAEARQTGETSLEVPRDRQSSADTGIAPRQLR